MDPLGKAMRGPIGSNEIQVAIQTVGSFESEPELIPTQLVKRTFDAFQVRLRFGTSDLYGRQPPGGLFLLYFD